MPVRKGYFLISCRIKLGGIKKRVVMSEITEEQFDILKRKKEITLIHDGNEVPLTINDIHCYGEIDFSNNSEDMNELDTFNWLDHLYYKGICVPADYDYETHTCHSPFKKYRYTETFRPSVLCQYAHGFLGKPKYVVIYEK